MALAASQRGWTAAAAGSSLGVERCRPARAQAARRSPKSRPTAAATSCAPRKSRPIRCCAGSTSSTRSTSCITASCFASAAPRCCGRAPTRASALLQRQPAARRPRARRPAHRRRARPRLLAFLHVAEKAAAGRFAIYREVVDDDPTTRAIFEEILRDEVFHMNYTLHAAGPRLAAVVPPAGLAGARQPAVEAVPARRGRASPALIGAIDPDARSTSSCCRRSRGWPGAPSGASAGVDRRSPRDARRLADEPVLT